MNKIEEMIDRFKVIDEERMRDLPFYNRQLSVEAVAFQESEDYYVGARITPWFINLMLLFKQQPDASAELGSMTLHQLPAGEQSFMVGEDEVIGRYDFISLASPTNKFKTQQQAREFAAMELAKRMSEDKAQVNEQPLQYMVVEDEKISRRDFLAGR